MKDTKKHSKFTVVEGFGNEFLRTSYVLLQEECEDRSLFSLCTSQMTDETKQEKHILASGRRGKRKVFWTANPFLAGLQNLFIAPARNLLEGPEIIVIAHHCLHRVPFVSLEDVESNRKIKTKQALNKHKTTIKGKAFRDFFSLYTLVEICPFNSKGRWTPISLSWLSWFDKIFVFLEKKFKLHRGFAQRSHSRRQG